MLSGAALVDIIGVKFLTGAFGIFFTGGIFPVASLSDTIIRDITGHIISGTGRNTFFEITIIIRAGVGRILTFGTGSLGISLLTAAFFIIKLIVIIRSAGSPVPVIIGIIAGKLIPRTGRGVGHKTGRGKLDEGGVVKPSPAPP